MSDDTVTEKPEQAEPVDPDSPDAPPPAPPTGWDPYAPPPAPTGWDPYSPPPAPPAPAGWDPYAPPPAPTGWDPYSPPPRPDTPPAPTGWDPYTPPPVQGGAAPPRPAPVGNGSGAVSGGWVHHRFITHLWSYNASPGVWAGVQGVGWKRLSPASESGHSHLTMLALLARNNRLAVSYHEDAHGQIDQLVV